MTTNPSRLLPVVCGLVLLIGLFCLSLLTGVSSFETHSYQLLLQSRLPRSLALVLTGVALSVAGVIMQLLTRNKFVEPSTTGTVEWATLGMLLMLLFFPSAPMSLKLLAACGCAFFGAGSFLLLINKITHQSDVIVPLTGIIYAGIISSLVSLIAYRFDLVMSIWVWVQGDFSMILKGRYELLWLSSLLCVLAYFTAHQFTLAGLGENVAKTLGLAYGWYVFLGISLVAMIAGITVATAGILPFLGLVIPNLVSLWIGDNLRRSLPWIALLGACFTLACDLLARVINYPYEIPVGIIMGVFGSLLFLTLLLKHRHHA